MVPVWLYRLLLLDFNTIILLVLSLGTTMVLKLGTMVLKLGTMVRSASLGTTSIPSLQAILHGWFLPDLIFVQ